MSEEATAAQPAPAPAAASNKVSFGSYSQEVLASGKSVKDVKSFIQGHYNVPNDALSFVNFQQVPDDYVLKDGESLQFHRPAGDKG